MLSDIKLQVDNIDLTLWNVSRNVKTILEQASRKEEEMGEESSPPVQPKPNAVWKPLLFPPIQPIKIAAVGEFLLAISHMTVNGRNLAVHAFSPDSHSWTLVGKLPAICATTSTVLTPQGELILLGGDAGNYEYSNRVHKVIMETPTSLVKKKARFVTMAV